jgi:hypothetical protein
MFRHSYFKLLLLLIIPAFIFLLKPGYYNMHDDMQMIRQLEMEKCLKDGQVPCRWSPDLGYGYGYPLFNFYPPMPYFVGQIFRTFSLSFVTTVKFTAISQFILAAIFIYILATDLFGPLGGLISALFYTYAPYHALNIYVRGAMNEAWAMVFFPLIFYFSKKIIEKKKSGPLNFFGLSLSLSGLLLSHNPMALTFAPFLALWCLYFLFQQKFNYKKIISLALSALFSLSLVAFYTLPVLAESKYVQIESMFINYYHYSVHFTNLYQLFISRFWSDGASVWGPNDNMSFQVGYLHWLLPLFIILYLAYLYLRRSSSKNKKLFLLPALLALSGFFAIFMTHQRSVFIWQLFPIIQKIQFPWRFLNHSIFLLSLSVGSLALFINKLKFPHRLIGLFLLFGALILLNQNYFHPLKSGPLTDAQKFEGLAWNNQITSGIYDYLPKTAATAAKSPASDYIDAITPDTGTYSISGTKKGTDWLFFNLKLDQDSQLILPVLDFPNFEIKDNGQLVEHGFEPELGRITLDLDRGEHQIYLKLRNTPIRTISNIVSLISLFYLVYCLLKKSCKLPKLKN